MDAPEVEGDQIDLRTKSDMKYRPYCKVYAPIDVPDWSFDSVGELNWIIFEEMIVEKDDPAVASVVKKRRTLYTKTYWQTFDAILDDGGKSYANKDLIVSEKHPNKINRVPVIPYTNIMFQPYFNHPPIDDILTINDAVLAGESELLTNILKQTYGQLVLPASAEKLVNRIRMKLMKADPDLDINSDAVRKVIAQEVNIELSRTKAIMEDAEERNIARYIQPSGANITNIIDHDDRLTGLMMKLYGFLVGVHTTQKESAESKSVDNISLAAQLSAIAARLEELENNIWQMFREYDSSITIPKIEYNRDYDINELKSVIAAIVELVNINAGEAYKKEVKLACVDVLDRIHTIPAENYEQIKREIDEDKESTTPITFEAQATHMNEASGSKPDAITARTDYQKGSASIKTTESI
ncbi:MAG: hypothetical protein EOM90_17430 [Alphaproteobacteria bacterium]|nr:hypothetical protein [Alphaproteobacteria bacterium]